MHTYSQTKYEYNQEITQNTPQTKSRHRDEEPQHARIQEFSSGGGPGQSVKKSSDNVFFSPQLILQKSNGQFQRNISFFKLPEGVQHFSGGGGVQLFPGRGGVQLLIPNTNPYIICDFPGGPDPLSPPLDPHLHRKLTVRRQL